MASPTYLVHTLLGCVPLLVRALPKTFPCLLPCACTIPSLHIQFIPFHLMYCLPPLDICMLFSTGELPLITVTGFWVAYRWMVSSPVGGGPLPTLPTLVRSTTAVLFSFLPSYLACSIPIPHPHPLQRLLLPFPCLPYCWETCTFIPWGLCPTFIALMPALPLPALPSCLLPATVIYLPTLLP